MSSLSFLSLLNGNNYATFNRELAHKIGLHEALILSEIIDKYEFFRREDSLIEINEKYGWFYLTMDKIFERTTLTEYQQRPAIKRLIEEGFIETVQYGQPCKRYFFINLQKLLEFFALDPKRDNHLNSINVCRPGKSQGLEVEKVKVKPLEKPTTIYKEQNPVSKNPDLRKDIVSLKNLKKGTLEPARRFKLTEEQIHSYKWLKSKNLNTNDETLCYWAKTYSLERLESAYLLAQERKPDNIGGFMTSIFQKNIDISVTNKHKCKEFLDMFMEGKNWPELKIEKKRVRFTNSDFELPFNMNPEEFARIIIDRYHNRKGY